MKLYSGVIASILGLTAMIQADNQPQKVSLAMEDQFERRQELKSFQGDVVVMLYGDRKATDANRTLGEKLFVQYHPQAKGLSASEARQTKSSEIAGLNPGSRIPNVHVVPVACIGKVPDVVKSLIRTQVKKGSPDVPVWMDCDNVMKDQFGVKEGEPNLVVIDAWGRLRFRVLGELDEKSYSRLIQVIDFLRKEAAGVR